MPQSAIATGLADYILRVEEMPKVLLQYVAQAHGDGAGMSLLLDTEKDPLAAILALVQARGKVDFRCYKPQMLLRRIRRRMGLTHRRQMNDYLQFLRDTPHETDALIRDLLIGVTSFFRESEAWQVLDVEVIPRLLTAKPSDGSLRVWVPGCATGEEAYSIGMLLLEQVKTTDHSGKIQIFATDIDREALDIGRAGIYPESIAPSVTPERLKRFFVRISQGYQVAKPLRETVVFASQNLITDPPFSRLDLISCRNLLIYFHPELQRKLLGLFHFALNKGGYLFLGKSETTTQRRGLFQPVSKRWRLYQSLVSARPIRPELPLLTRYAPDPPPPGPGQRPGSVPGYRECVQQLLLQRCAPAAVLVDRDYRTLYFHGQTDDYLVHPPGEPTDDLLAMARAGLRLTLRAALHQTMREEKAVSVVAEVKERKTSRCVQVTVTPVEDTEPKLWLVTFAGLPEPQPAVAPTPSLIEEPTVVRHLEDELFGVKTELQSTIAELEASNQELRVSNEETLSINEKLETSKEELQSLNEELVTVNLQLEDKVLELERANNDLSNLLSSTHIAALFLDRSLRIRRYTPACTRLFNLIPTDAGRPITDIAGPCTDTRLLQDARHVIENPTLVEKEVSTASDEWYLRRVLPYRTQEDRIEGVVVTYTDITGLKRVDEDTRRLATVIRDSNDAITVSDFDGRLLAWNRGAELLYGYGEADGPYAQGRRPRASGHPRRVSRANGTAPTQRSHPVL
jgi:two-component system CheB/CheR fusion protein